MSDRTRLSHRRPALTRDIAVGAHRFAVTLGFNEAGSPREVFAAGAREGSDMRALISDACVVISIALQHGVAPRALGRSLGAAPVPGRPGVESPVSAVGAIIRAVIEEARA